MQTLFRDNQVCWFEPEAFVDFSADSFGIDWWRQHGQVLGESHGRGVTWFVQQTGKPALVLRHYWRGGLMGRLFGDRFWWQPLSRSRAMAEFALLGQLQAAGLPVPKPVAARCVRHGLFYRADLLIERIPNARDLVAILRERALSDGEWQAVGRVIRQMHAVGAWHSDLNAHNLLLDNAGKIWVIDFDKCGIRSPGSWQQDMLDRLLRSLRKESGLHPAFYWQPTDWTALLSGYQSL